jgi:nitrite reductase/ring-hydroxylating ferredoxin subunit
MAWVKVCPLAALPPGAVTEFRIGDEVFALCNHEGRVHALEGTCPHAHGPMGQGLLNGRSIVCPWHFWGFDVETGENDYDASVKLRTFAVEIVEGEIYLNA